MSHKPSPDREELAISQAQSYNAPGVRVFYDRQREVPAFRRVRAWTAARL
jgi:hypothetical protein